MKISPADKYFSLCVREAADNTCVRCGRNGRTECSHIHGRRHRTIRWCKENALAKCSTCHRWWHENPTESGLWFTKEYGDGLDAILIEKRNSRVKVSKLDEKDIAKHYKAEYERLLKRRSNGETGRLDFDSYQ